MIQEGGGGGGGGYKLVNTRERRNKIRPRSWESVGATRASPSIMLEPLACIIILSVSAAQHAPEKNRRSADHLPGEHPRGRRNFPSASPPRRFEADRTAQRNFADVPRNSRTSLDRRIAPTGQENRSAHQLHH